MTSTPGLWHSVRHTVPVIVVVSFITLALEHAGFLDHFETAGLDAFNVLKAARDPTDVVLIGIQDADYDAPALFNGTSPLKCETVLRVLRAIAAGHPSVIGVDLDTSSPSFACLNAPEDWPPIVWAQDALWDADHGRFTIVPHLGGTPAAQRRGDAAGIGIMPQDADGVIRRYYRTMPISGGLQAASFPWALVNTACGKQCQRCCEAKERADPSAPLRLNFAGERFSFQPLSVRFVLQAAEAPNGTGWQDNGPLVGKIVLLGGDYRAARDSHVTPVGVMNGMQIMAQAIESELHGGGIRSIDEGLMFVVDLIVGILMAALLYWLGEQTARALWVSLLAMPIVCLVASFVVFSTLGFWFNFVTVAVSALIHQLYERAVEHQPRAVA